jgi:hypothetical protein
VRRARAPRTLIVSMSPRDYPQGMVASLDPRRAGSSSPGNVVITLMTTDHEGPSEHLISGDPAVDLALRIFGIMFV